MTSCLSTPCLMRGHQLHMLGVNTDKQLLMSVNNSGVGRPWSLWEGDKSLCFCLYVGAGKRRISVLFILNKRLNKHSVFLIVICSFIFPRPRREPALSSNNKHTAEPTNRFDLGELITGAVLTQHPGPMTRPAPLRCSDDRERSRGGRKGGGHGCLVFQESSGCWPHLTPQRPFGLKAALLPGCLCSKNFCLCFRCY